MTINVVKPQAQKATITSFSPASGPVGTEVTIIGTNLLSTTQVTFNGKIATNLQVVSASTVKATVPAGAKSGKIALTTASGTVSSSTKFTVTAGLAAASEVGLQVVDQQELMAYPNPFYDKATISFGLRDGGDYSVSLYDARGALVKVLQEGVATSGTVTRVEVDGASIARGLYLVKMQTSEGIRTIKLLFVK